MATWSSIDYYRHGWLGAWIIFFLTSYYWTKLCLGLSKFTESPPALYRYERTMLKVRHVDAEYYSGTLVDWNPLWSTNLSYDPPVIALGGWFTLLPPTERGCCRGWAAWPRVPTSGCFWKRSYKLSLVRRSTATRELGLTTQRLSWQSMIVPNVIWPSALIRLKLSRLLSRNSYECDRVISVVERDSRWGSVLTT